MKIVPWSRCDVTSRSNKYIVYKVKKKVWNSWFRMVKLKSEMAPNI